MTYDVLTEMNLRRKGPRCPNCGEYILPSNPQCDNCGEYYEPAYLEEGCDERFARDLNHKWWSNQENKNEMESRKKRERGQDPL